jgi:non-ribosomal peptide synthetase-like protein
VPAGRRLPENVLIGISTVAGEETMRPGSAWFGHPSFELPRREIVEFDRRLTYEPSRIRYLNRLSWEVARFKLPVAPAALVLIWLKVLATAQAATSASLFYCAVVPLAGFGAVAALCLPVLIVKWVVLGRVRPGRHPLWSCWCSRWDYLYVIWGRYAHGPLSALEGTLLLPWFLRAMGMRIGRRVVLGAGFAQVVDPDMLRIDDGATVNCMFQAHTFEDRVLKIDRIHIGRRATLGAASVPLYGADVGELAYVAPHSVIMKQEHLLAGRRYEGAPTR